MVNEIIKQRIADELSNFFYHSRKEDEDLPVGEIDRLLESGEMSLDELCQEFVSGIKHRFGA